MQAQAAKFEVFFLKFKERVCGLSDTETTLDKKNTSN